MGLFACSIPCRRALFGTVVAVFFLAPFTPAQAPQPGDAKQPGKNWLPSVGTILQRIDKEHPSLETLYKQLHASPELAFNEEQTAARMAKELKDRYGEYFEGGSHIGIAGALVAGQGTRISPQKR